MRTRLQAVRYLPIDTVLALPRIRILRTMQHFDWVSALDVRIALDVNDDDQQANAITKTFSRLVDQKLLDRHGDRVPFRYRLNDRGRAELAAYLAKAQVTDKDEPSRCGGHRKRRAREAGVQA